ncbi:MAG: AAA family ATPase, partial [Atopostipes sp.]|nr:AAA family ATPase [Atopostipes sp.]
MQLKKIILKGFKSFPDKTLLEFDEGVTAIVGPNGSGKSNIIEAIRWVMGEQSAKTLRGTRMDDIIFSGTHQRKAINIAEVELILDNSDGYLDIDYEEVSILRRLSRTSGSTYMINQQECRLKDIVNLFMDSGLGKESFSVISQGEVEAIFNSKPKDRRGIFEEAAGVFKYKVRKEDAEKKLDQTEDNLDRVRDILYELESQLEPLRKQADIAKSYLEHKEKLTDLDIALSVHQIKELSEEMTTDIKEQEKLEWQLKKVEKEINELENEKENQEKALEEAREEFEELNEKRIQTVREKERLEASLNLFDEKTKHRDEFIQEKEKSIKELETRNEKEQKDLAEIRKAYAEEKEGLAKINQKIVDLEKRRSYLEGDQNVQMEELRSQYIDYLQKETSLKNKNSYLEEELSRNQIEKEKIDKKVFELKR